MGISHPTLSCFILSRLKDIHWHNTPGLFGSFTHCPHSHPGRWTDLACLVSSEGERSHTWPLASVPFLREYPQKASFCTRGRLPCSGVASGWWVSWSTAGVWCENPICSQIEAQLYKAALISNEGHELTSTDDSLVLFLLVQKLNGGPFPSAFAPGVPECLMAAPMCIGTHKPFLRFENLNGKFIWFQFLLLPTSVCDNNNTDTQLGTFYMPDIVSTKIDPEEQVFYWPRVFK